MLLSIPIVQLHVATGTLDCWANLVKDVYGFCLSCLKSSATSSDTESLPGDFPLLTVPVRTSLLITFLMWASNDFFCFIKLRYLARWARYSCLQAVTEYTHSSFTNVPKQNFRTYASTKSFENDYFVVLSFDQRELL
mgnify:FL=1